MIKLSTINHAYKHNNWHIFSVMTIPFFAVSCIVLYSITLNTTIRNVLSETGMIALIAWPILFSIVCLLRYQYLLEGNRYLASKTIKYFKLGTAVLVLYYLAII